MTEDTTIRPEQSAADQPQMQHESIMEQASAPQPTAAGQTEVQTAVQTAQGVVCPYCGSTNEQGAIFCLSCGRPLQKVSCPNCGSEMDPEADFCEVCHHYIRTDVCSFCGAALSGSEAYCPECGSPRGGIVCPTCRTLNDFAFCKQCGTPLTEEARQLVAMVRQQPDYQELVRLAREYEQLQMELPLTSERDKIRDQQNHQLRERLLRLLAADRGQSTDAIKTELPHRRSKEELTREKEDRLDQLTRLLDAMAIPMQTSPVKARNYAMAQKPVGVRLAWVCNYKHAMHSSPCGCAKPQLGGKWIILGKNTKQEIKDDKS